jgi:hypothetical protein
VLCDRPPPPPLSQRLRAEVLRARAVSERWPSTRCLLYARELHTPAVHVDSLVKRMGGNVGASIDTLVNAGVATRDAERDGARFRLHLSRIAQQYRADIVHQHVSEMFGDAGMWVYRTLERMPHLEQRLLADVSLLALKDVRTITANMLSHDWLQVLFCRGCL